MAEAPTSETVYTKLHRIAMQAKDAPQMVFNNLAHLVDLDLLREAHRRTRKDGAPVLDGTTAADYAQNLEENLQDLLDRMKSGLYYAPSVKRVHIPKDDKGNTRPIGIPTISPLLANIYLHEVLDKWFEQDVKPVLEAPAALVRYADDFVIVFQSHRDAVRVWNVLPKRLGKFGLALHEQKTRLVDFRKPSGEFRPETFDFLGFTHYWGKNKFGGWVVLRKTSGPRLKRGLKGIAEYCADNRHAPVEEQHKTLSRKVLGHFSYLGLAGNCRALANFLFHVRRTWRKWLSRRSQKGYVSWEKMKLLLERYPLPPTTARTPQHPLATQGRRLQVFSRPP